MKFGYLMKVVQYNLLQQGGVSVTPEQLGLKGDPFAKFRTGNTPFANVLNGLRGNTNASAALPQPPQPPSGASDDQLRYHNEMVAYNQRLHAHNQQVLSLLMSQIQRLGSQPATAQESAAATEDFGSSLL